MKLTELVKLGLLPKTRKDIDVDHVPIIVSDCFNRKGDYRENAVDTLIELNMPFHSEYNILYTMAKRFLKVTCPKCGIIMEVNGASGSGSITTIQFVCPLTECACQAHITLAHDAFSITPKESNQSNP